MVDSYYLFASDLGLCAIVGREGRISHLIPPGRNSDDQLLKLPHTSSCDMQECKSDFSGQATRLQAYFSGEIVDFTCNIAPVSTSSFDLDVWKAARDIPYGEVRTYGWIAERIGRPGAGRAVGQALGRNPIPIIVPCHRVIRSDGNLGGFAFGIEYKIRLLAMEAANKL